MGDGPSPPSPEPGLPAPSDALLWLLSPAAHAPGSGAVRLVETHMSWVLLDERCAMKLKKPLKRPPWLDFSTPARRLHACRLEVQLNRRLAPQVYRGLLALQWQEGRFSLAPVDGPGVPAHAVDWLVLMNRLPDDLMLDRLIASGQLQPAHVAALAEVLASFYRHAEHVPAQAHAGCMHRRRAESRRHAEVLLRPSFGLADAGPLIERFDDALRRHAGLLEARARAGRIVDGHGDLRPEHVCLLVPPVVIDCLEFAAVLREVDPFEELAFLGMECAMAGAPWVGPQLRAACSAALQDWPPATLAAFYTADRALLRARLAAAHLLDAQPRTPQRWLPLARRYLAVAAQALDEVEGFSAAMPRGSA